MDVQNKFSSFQLIVTNVIESRANGETWIIPENIEILHIGDLPELLRQYDNVAIAAGVGNYGKGISHNELRYAAGRFGEASRSGKDNTLVIGVDPSCREAFQSPISWIGVDQFGSPSWLSEQPNTRVVLVDGMTYDEKLQEALGERASYALFTAPEPSNCAKIISSLVPLVVPGGRISVFFSTSYDPITWTSGVSDPTPDEIFNSMILLDYTLSRDAFERRLELINWEVICRSREEHVRDGCPTSIQIRPDQIRDKSRSVELRGIKK